MKSTLIFSLITFISIGIYGQEFYSDHFTVDKLNDGIYAVIHKTGGYAICNSGIIDLGEETLVFDTFISPEAAKDLKNAAEQLTGNKVNYVINSHFHNDHIRGNQVFTDAEIISTQKSKQLIEETEPEQLAWEKSVIDQRIKASQQMISEETDFQKLDEHKMWLGYYKAIKESFNEYVITLPNRFIEDTLIIRGSDREVVLLSLGKGHTESDIILWIPSEKILFTGDLLFVERHPWLGDGFTEEWIGNLNELKKMNARFIIPGHGSLGDNRNMDLMIEYLTSINAIVSKAIDENQSEEELKRTDIPEAYKKWWFGKFFVPNLINLFRLKMGLND